MEGRPIKFRILEILDTDGPSWSNDIVKQLQSEYNMPSDYQRDCLNFDLIEVDASGMITELESRIDTEGEYKADALLSKYKITPIGVGLLAELKSKVKPKKNRGE